MRDKRRPNSNINCSTDHWYVVIRVKCDRAAEGAHQDDSVEYMAVKRREIFLQTARVET